MEAFFHYGDEQIDGHGDPDLAFHGVLGGAEEALEAQVLLDLFKEQLDLPTAFVELRDGQNRQGEVVGQENERVHLRAIEVQVDDAHNKAL